MDEILYNAFVTYYDVLSKTGYLAYPTTHKLLVMAFYRDFTMNDYRGTLNKEDYHLIEEALDCIYGTNCLMPYPDYLKMGKLRLGDMTELSQRVQNLEDTNVVKILSEEGGTFPTDIEIIEEE